MVIKDVLAVNVFPFRNGIVENHDVLQNGVLVSFKAFKTIVPVDGRNPKRIEVGVVPIGIRNVIVLKEIEEVKTKEGIIS